MRVKQIVEKLRLSDGTQRPSDSTAQWHILVTLGAHTGYAWCTYWLRLVHILVTLGAHTGYAWCAQRLVTGALRALFLWHINYIVWSQRPLSRVFTSSSFCMYCTTVGLNLFWPMDHLFKKHPMDQFAALTPREQHVETALHIGQWKFYQRLWKSLWTTRNSRWTMLKIAAVRQVSLTDIALAQ